jgi:hypothetical protein
MTLEESLRNLAPAAVISEQAYIAEDDDHQQIADEETSTDEPATDATQLELESAPPEDQDQEGAEKPPD